LSTSIRERLLRDVARLQKDKIFDPLRSNDGFRNLIREMEKQTSPATKPSTAKAKTK
jgi:hypothetical protein